MVAILKSGVINKLTTKLVMLCGFGLGPIIHLSLTFTALEKELKTAKPYFITYWEPSKNDQEQFDQ